MAVNNNLYPPIVATYMPAFLINSGNAVKDTCRVYFSISAYNSLSDIMNAQVAIYDQDTNVSVLDEKKYPCSIKLTSIYEDTTRESLDRYYIDITKDDIIGGSFEINKYYKVQIRFTSINAQSVDINDPQIDSWLAGNLSMFSEWSTVCLVRGISAPKISIKNIEATSGYTVWTAGNVDIVGNLTFANEAETERLKSYNIKLYKGDDFISESGDIYGSIYTNVNEINYTFKYAFEDGETYKVELTYVTTNLYTETIVYNLMVIQGGETALEAKITTDIDEENGRTLVHILGDTADDFSGNIMIRRTSSESNFTIWEDMYLIKANQQQIDFTWYDNTIKSGVWYYYCAQKVNSIGQRSVIIKTQDPTMIVLDHMYLSSGTKQLKIKFNPQVSSYQRTVFEAKTDTIGSKYPFIKRNGHTEYRQFSISGLISHFVDEDGLFISRDEMYNEDIVKLYDTYNQEKRITPHNDYTYERDFREKVMDFLYENKAKLFRSPTEGNILVKLMNISFTPNQQLGRLVYSFTATAYEIDDATVDNFKIYGIQTIDEYLNQIFSYTKDYIGQLQDSVIPANTDVLKYIASTYQSDASEGYVTTTEYLDHVKFEMEDEPYLIMEGASGPYKVGDLATYSRARVAADLNNAYVGYIVYINDQAIVIPADGHYELKGADVKVYSMYFPVDTTISMSYNATIKESEDFATMHIAENFFTRMGQLWGTFKYEEPLYTKIWNKYYENYSSYTQSLVSINSVNIEAEPGTVIYIKENYEDNYDRHVVGETARLDLGDPDILVEGLYFAGVHLTEASEAEAARQVCPENKFIRTDIEASSFEEIDNPLLNNIYKINGVDYIYYHNVWYTFNENNDIVCPVTALVDYCYDLMKGLYA